MHCEVIVNGLDLRKLLMSRRFKKDLDGGEKNAKRKRKNNLDRLGRG